MASSASKSWKHRSICRLAAYSRKIGRHAFSSQLNVQNLFNHYTVWFLPNGGFFTCEHSPGNRIWYVDPAGITRGSPARLATFLIRSVVPTEVPPYF